MKMATAESTPTLIAWSEVLEKFKRSLPAKDLKQLQSPIRPEEIVQQLEQWNTHRGGKKGKVASVIQNGVTRIKRFNECVDVLAQGLPAPATLVWSSAWFVLKIVEDALDEYDKVCHVLIVMLDSLPRVEIYADTSSKSVLVQECVHDLFVSFIHFWMKACKFYRQRRLWNFMRNSWNDYDVEFSRLEGSMTRALNRIEKGALVEHIREQALMTAQIRQTPLQEDGELFALLDPSLGGMERYVHDHEQISRMRHPKTCHWILRNRQFVEWLQLPIEEGSRLWIRAGPGAGKTVVTSQIIDHLKLSSECHPYPVLLYFYFKESNQHNNSAAAANLSMAYQLYKQHKSSRSSIVSVFRMILNRAELHDDSVEGRCNLLSKYYRSPPNVILVLDGLDECHDVEQFLSQLLEELNGSKVRILVSSRHDKQIQRHLEGWNILELTPEDIQDDVTTYAESKTSSNSRLSNALVRQKILENLTGRHEGMFLWVYMMLKELKACVSVEDVQRTLNQAASGLEGICRIIVQRLQRTLTRRAAELAKSILTWILGSARSLSVGELREALSFHYKTGGHTLLSDAEFPYSDREVELMCGSLITIRDGQIQTKHQTMKEHLTDLGRQQHLTIRTILPDSNRIPIYMTSICLQYLDVTLTTHFEELQYSITEPRIKEKVISELQAANKLLEYACFFWIHHMIDCPTDNAEDASRLLSKYFDGSMTLSWMVVSLLLDSRSLWRLPIGFGELQDWSRDMNTELTSNTFRTSIQEWCLGVSRCLESYGDLILKRPWMIWRFDLNTVINVKLPKARRTESEYVFQDALTPVTQEQKIPLTSHLGHNQKSLFKARLGFFVYDPSQKIFLTGELDTDELGECLFVQQEGTGKRLAPAVAGLSSVPGFKDYLYGLVQTAKISPNGKYLAIAYDKWLSVWVIEQGLKFSHRLRNRRWAFRYIADQYQEKCESWTSETISFDGSNKLLVPGGWYNLESKVFYHLTNKNSVDLPGKAPSLSFTGDASYIFTVREMDSANRITRKSSSEYANGRSITHTFDVDLCYRIKPGGGRSSIPAKLLNVDSRETFDVSNGLDNFGSASFQFDLQDKWLVTFLLGARAQRAQQAVLTVTVWGLSKSAPRKCSQGQILVLVATHPATILNPPLITMGGDGAAWIITCDRVLQEVRFNMDEVSFPRYVPVVHDWTNQISQLSQDSQRLSIVQVLFSEVHLQILDLASNRLKELIFEARFALPKENPNPIERPIALSPNLDLLVIGPFAFVINSSQFSCNTSPIKLNVNLCQPDRDWPWNCNISSCGTFISFDKPAYKHHTNFYDPQPGRLHVFRIDRTERTSSQLAVPVPSDLQVGSPVFHSSKSLAAFGYLRGDGRDNVQRVPQTPLVPARQLSLRMMHLDEDDIKALPILDFDGEVLSKLGISDCGTFTYLEGENGSGEPPKRRILVSEISCPPTPFSRLSNEQPAHPSRDRCYGFTACPWSVKVTMYKYKSDSTDEKYPVSQTVIATSMVDDFAAFPMQLGCPSRAWLLLGNDHSALMKLLLRPDNGTLPCIKSLTESWDTVRDQLERTLKPVGVESNK